MKRRIGTIYEMGIDLTKHGKESYLGKAHKKSADIKSAQESAKQVLDAIKNVRWQDLGIAHHDGHYFIVLPPNIQDLIRAYREANPTQRDTMGTWFGLDGNHDGVYMNVDSGTNRSHFPGGIPEIMKGTGLGYKCYRRLLEQKTWLTSNTGGSNIKNHAWASMIKKRPDPDDVHAIVGPSNVLAMVKQLSPNRKIEIANNFIQTTILPNSSEITDKNFAIDDELKQILPQETLNLLDPERRVAAQRAAEEEQRLANQRRTQEDERRNTEMRPTFGVSVIDRNFRPGDIVVRYSMLTSPHTKPRIVARIGDDLKAISIDNYMNLSQNINYYPTEIRDLNDTWTKINIASIPDLHRVNLTSENEIAYLQALIQAGQTSAPAAHTEQARNLAVQVLRRNQQQTQSFDSGPRITIYNSETYFDIANNRLPTLPEAARTKIKQEGFIKEIYMTVDQYARYRDNKSSEVFAGFSGTAANMTLTHGAPQKAINTITGFIVDDPNRKPFAAKFNMVTVRNKRDVRQGDMVYIATHPVYFGLTARVSYSAATGQQREFVYVEIFNPQIQGQKGRKVPISPQFLRKLRIVA